MQYMNLITEFPWKIFLLSSAAQNNFPLDTTLLLTHLAHPRSQQVLEVILTVGPVALALMHHNARTEDRQAGATWSWGTPS